jgi:hypothetical protein
MQPRDHMIGWLSANIPDIIIDPDRSGFDIKGQLNSGDLKIFYQLEVMEEWEEEWPENWEEIHLPSKNKILIDQWYKSYRDDMLTFIVYRKDLKKAWHIAGDIAMESEVKNNFICIPIKHTYQVDMNYDTGNS